MQRRWTTSKRLETSTTKMGDAWLSLRCGIGGEGVFSLQFLSRNGPIEGLILKMSGWRTNYVRSSLGSLHWSGGTAELPSNGIESSRDNVLREDKRYLRQCENISETRLNHTMMFTMNLEATNKIVFIYFKHINSTHYRNGQTLLKKNKVVVET